MTDSNLQDRVIALVRDLRNHRNVEKNWPEFRELVETRLPDVLRQLSTRWLISVCDTYVDFGEPRRFDALLRDDPVMDGIWREILRRLHAGDNVITELAHGSPVEARYFPLDHRGLTDNYGR